MRLKTVELDLEWPVEIPVNGLRFFVLEKLEHYGEPLRWAITNTMRSEKSLSSRFLKIEAVVIIP